MRRHGASPQEYWTWKGVISARPPSLDDTGNTNPPNPQPSGKAHSYSTSQPVPSVDRLGSQGTENIRHQCRACRRSRSWHQICRIIGQGPVGFSADSSSFTFAMPISVRSSWTECKAVRPAPFSVSRVLPMKTGLGLDSASSPYGPILALAGAAKTASSYLGRQGFGSQYGPRQAVAPSMNMVMLQAQEEGVKE
jgi:hypothetical protein